MAKRNDFSLGIIFIIIGVVVFLLNTNILPNDVLLVGLGIALLVAYYFKRHLGYLMAGLILAVIGTTSLIEKYLVVQGDLTELFFMWGLGIVFMVLYFSKHIKGFVYPGCILPAIGTYSFLDEVYSIEMGWVFFLLLGIAFYVIYLVEYRNTGSNWPIIPGTVLIILSGLFLLTSKDIINSSFWKTISYIWPVILILVGGKIIYNNSKLKQ